MPDDDEFADYPRLGVEGKKKILGLNAAKLYGVEVPEELQVAGAPADPAARGRSRGVTLRAQVLEALGTVYDPELDEPITTLGFVGSCVVAGGDVAVRLRLPTPQCAPNFAFLMAADARAAVRRRRRGRDGQRRCSRTTTRERRSTARSRRGEGFAEAFPGETAGALEALRELFQRKALVARAGPAARRIPAATLRRAHRPRRRALPGAAPASSGSTRPTTRRRS